MIPPTPRNVTSPLSSGFAGRAKRNRVTELLTLLRMMNLLAELGAIHCGTTENPPDCYAESGFAALKSLNR